MDDSAQVLYLHGNGLTLPSFSVNEMSLLPRQVYKSLTRSRGRAEFKTSTYRSVSFPPRPKVHGIFDDLSLDVSMLGSTFCEDVHGRSTVLSASRDDRGPLQSPEWDCSVTWLEGDTLIDTSGNTWKAKAPSNKLATPVKPALYFASVLDSDPTRFSPTSINERRSLSSRKHDDNSKASHAQVGLQSHHPSARPNGQIDNAHSLYPFPDVVGLGFDHSLTGAGRNRRPFICEARHSLPAQSSFKPQGPRLRRRHARADLRGAYRRASKGRQKDLRAVPATDGPGPGSLEYQITLALLQARDRGRGGRTLEAPGCRRTEPGTGAKGVFRTLGNIAQTLGTRATGKVRLTS